MGLSADFEGEPHKGRCRNDCDLHMFLVQDELLVELFIMILNRDLGFISISPCVGLQKCHSPR